MQQSLSGLASLLVENNLNAEEITFKESEKPPISLSEETQIIKPTLEEITTLLSKEPSEILQPAIERDDIKRFEYTRQTKSEDLYAFLKKEFHNKVIFVYLIQDILTQEKNKHISTNDSTYDRKLGAGSAIAFLWTRKNLIRKGDDVGFLFLGLKNFYGEDNWWIVCSLFRKKSISFPSYIEFIKDSNGNYQFKGIVDAGFKKPENIWKSIEINVDYYSKK